MYVSHNTTISIICRDAFMQQIGRSSMDHYGAAIATHIDWSVSNWVKLSDDNHMCDKSTHGCLSDRRQNPP